MMTTNLSVIANVKQLRTGGSFRILLPFFRTSWAVGILNSATFNSFHNRVEFGTILEGLRNFGGEHPKTPFGTPLAGRKDILFGHLILHKSEDLSRQLFRCPHGSVWWLADRPHCLLGS